MSVLKTVGIELIDANPFRCLDQYPWNEAKLTALQRSIADVGFWEGVIARPHGKRYQMAFGHHRLEAAKRSDLNKIPLIERELTDEQMLQFMGRENGEDYSTDFLTMLNTWDGAVTFMQPKDLTDAEREKIECALEALERGDITREKSNVIISKIDPDWWKRDRIRGFVDGRRQKLQAEDIATLLGWVEHHKERGMVANQIARACANANNLIMGGYLQRDDLVGLSVFQAREIVGRANARMEQLDKAGRDFGRPHKETETAKRQVAKAATITAKKARKGEVATKELRRQVDTEAYRVAARSKVKVSPLFAVFGKALADGIEKMLSNDSAAEKLQAIVDALPNLTHEDDAATVRRVDFQLGELGKRTAAWKKRLLLEKVIRDRFPLLEGGKA